MTSMKNWWQVVMMILVWRECLIIATIFVGAVDSSPFQLPKASSASKIIRVGDLTYDTTSTTTATSPEKTIPQSISRILMQLDTVRNGFSSSEKKKKNEEMSLEIAAVLVQLGLAHQELLNKAIVIPMKDRNEDRKSAMEQHKRYAVNAFHEAIRILLQETSPTNNSFVKDHGGADNDHVAIAETSLTIQTLLGDAYFGLAETYFLAHDDVEQQSNQQEDPLTYYQKAHDIYFHLLFEGEADQDGNTIDSYIPRPMNHFEDMRDFYDLELRWAHACARLGTFLMEQKSRDFQQILDDADDNIQYSSDGATASSKDQEMQAELSEFIMAYNNNRNDPSDETGLEKMKQSLTNLMRMMVGEQALELLLEEGAQNLRRLDRVETYQYNAASVYKKAMVRSHPKPDRIEYARSLVTALQNLGTVRLYKKSPESYQLAIDTYLEAIHVYETEIFVSSDEENASHDRIDAHFGMAESMLSLAKAFLQLGKYNEAKQWYKKCMNWNEKHGRDPSWDPKKLYATGFSSINSPEDEQIQQLEQALNEYRTMMTDSEADTIMFEEMEEAILTEDYYYIEKSDAYEADLHNKLGTMYLNRGDHVLAFSHLEEAIRLYEQDGEQDEVNMASAKYNLSLLHLREGEYQNSAKLYNEALDSFKASVGEGENPLISGFEYLGLADLVRKHGTKIEDVDFSNQSSEKVNKDAKQASANQASTDTKQRGTPMLMFYLENVPKQNESSKDEL